MKWTARSPIVHAFHPPKCRIFPLVSVATNRAAVASHGLSPNKKRPPTVDCGMVVFFGRDRRSNKVRPLQFGQGIKPPAGRISPRTYTPLNGAATPLPVRIGPHPRTLTVIMVLRWEGRGGFVLFHP